MALRPSRRLLRRELHRLVDDAFDREETACFETVKANEHLEFYEYSSRNTPLRKRMKTTVFAISDQPERRKVAR